MTTTLTRHPYLSFLFVITAIFYAFVLPPFEIHDETAHFAKTAQLAFWTYPSVHEDTQPGAMVPGPLARFIGDWPPDEPSQGATKRPVSHVWHDLAAPADSSGGMAFASFAYLGSYPPILYVPQALGLRLGYLAGLPPLGQFYAGRLTGAAVAIMLVMLGVALMPYGGRSLLIIASLPGVSSQLGSYSADSVIFSVAFLTIAILLRGYAARGTRANWALPILIPLLTLAKGVYLPIAAAGMADRTAWRPRHLAWTLLWIAAGVGLFIIWFGVLSGGDINVQHYTSHYTLRHMTAATPHDQFLFMVAHPYPATRAVISTIIERLPVYIMDCIGRFGAFNVLLPLPLYVLGVGVVLGTLLASGPDQYLPTPWQRVLWLGIAAAVVILVHIALYMVSTALGEDYVEGVQGRYFIPILPLIVLAPRLRTGTALGRIVDATLPGGAALLMAGGLVTAALAFWHG